MNEAKYLIEVKKSSHIIINSISGSSKHAGTKHCQSNKEQHRTALSHHIFRLSFQIGFASITQIRTILINLGHERTVTYFNGYWTTNGWQIWGYIALNLRLLLALAPTSPTATCSCNEVRSHHQPENRGVGPPRQAAMAGATASWLKRFSSLAGTRGKLSSVLVS